jgi:hypothetical protein
VLAWSRFRFVRFAAGERAETTLALLAECFEVLGGVPGTVLAGRMGCLKGGVVANVVVPTAEYVRFAAHYGFRPDFCEAADPESKGIVEHLVGYAKAGLVVPQAPFGGLAAAAWCAEVNGVVHSEICAVPAERLVIERELLGRLPSLRPGIGKLVTRKVDRLSCVRFASARYSVLARLIGAQVGLRIDEACDEDRNRPSCSVQPGAAVSRPSILARSCIQLSRIPLGGRLRAAARREPEGIAAVADPFQVADRVAGASGRDQSPM